MNSRTSSEVALDLRVMIRGLCVFLLVKISGGKGNSLYTTEQWFSFFKALQLFLQVSLKQKPDLTHR